RRIVNQSVRVPLLLLLSAVALVLLVACANLANLVLARGLQRRGEVVIRIALGARRSRIIRQLASEAIPIALTGALCGLLLAKWLRPFLVAMAPSTFQQVKVVLYSRVLLFISFLTLLTAVLFAIAPAIQLSGTKDASGLNSGMKGIIKSDTGARIRAAFVI